MNEQIILVAGGSGQVGEGITRQFLKAGATVVVPSRRQSSLDGLTSRMGDLAAKLHTVVAEIGTEAGANALRDQIQNNMGKIDHVVAAVGGWWQGKPLTEVDLPLWHQLVDNSLTAHFIIARTFLPPMFHSNGSYTLINGGGALHPVPTAGPIVASAAGQLMLGNVLAVENQDNGVRVNNLVLATPVITRARPNGQPGWVSADDAGRYCVKIANGTLHGESIIFDNPAQAA